MLTLSGNIFSYHLHFQSQQIYVLTFKNSRTQYPSIGMSVQPCDVTLESAHHTQSWRILYIREGSSGAHSELAAIPETVGGIGWSVGRPRPLQPPSASSSGGGEWSPAEGARKTPPEFTGSTMSAPVPSSFLPASRKVPLSAY